MKKFALLLAALILLCAVAPMSAFAAEEKMFWVSHFNDGFVEGSGVIFTQEDSAGGWWIHVAFEPVSGLDETYKIVAITNGLTDGSATPVEVPDGGFVWAANYGNNYPALNMGDIDYTSPNCQSAIDDACTWTVGMMLTINGVDFDMEIAPTDTAGTMWYDDAYVCTASYSVYEGDVPATSDAPADETSEDSAADDSAADDSSASESKTEESKKDDSSVATSSDASDDVAEETNNNMLWIIIAVAGVVVVAVVVAVVLKKK